MISNIAPASDTLISVVISNYNYAHYMEAAIQSVLEQTYNKIEIIVVDDGSTDDSREVINAFKGKIASIFQDHKGQCSALNAGFSASRGDIIIFLDSDDSLVADAIERLAHPFIGNQAIAKCQGYMNAIDAEGHSLRKRVPPHLSPSGSYKDEVLKHGPSATRDAWTSGNAWARWFLEQVMPLPEDTENSVFPDGCLNPLAALYGPVVTLEKPVALYRIHGHNNGPAGYVFNEESLSKFLSRKHNNYIFVAQRAENIDLKPLLEDWFKEGNYWSDKLKEYAIRLMNPSQRTPQTREVILAPFETSRVGSLKAYGLAIILAIICLTPRQQALWMIRRLLRMPAPQTETARVKHDS